MIVDPTPDHPSDCLSDSWRVASGDAFSDKFFHALELSRETVSATGKSQ